MCNRRVESRPPPQQIREGALAFARDADVGVQVRERRFREDAVARTAHDDGRRRHGSTRADDVAHRFEQEARRVHVLIVDVARRDADNVRLKGTNGGFKNTRHVEMTLGPGGSRERQVHQRHLVSGPFSRRRDLRETQRQHLHVDLLGVRRNEENLHGPIVSGPASADSIQGPQPGDRSPIWREENAIYLATDPVALDVVTREIILAKRRAARLSDKRSQSRHIETAAAKGLGVGDLSRIDVTTIRV